MKGWLGDVGRVKVWLGDVGRVKVGLPASAGVRIRDDCEKPSTPRPASGELFHSFSGEVRFGIVPGK